MTEILEPARESWFAPDGTPLIFYSREPNGTLRFWNRGGLTPDRRLDSQPVTAAIRSEWEQIESVHSATKAREAAQREDETRQRAALEEQRCADEERLSTDGADHRQTQPDPPRRTEAKRPEQISPVTDQSAGWLSARGPQPTRSGFKSRERKRRI